VSEFNAPPDTIDVILEVEILEAVITNAQPQQSANAK